MYEELGPFEIYAIPEDDTDTYIEIKTLQCRECNGESFNIGLTIDNQKIYLRCQCGIVQEMRAKNAEMA